MHVKQVLISPSDIKAGPEDDLAEGEFVVYPSTFIRSPDAYGDVVAKGAFAEGIAKRKAEGIVLSGLYGHNMYDPHYNVAYAIDEEEDEHGWKVHGGFDMDDPTAVKVYKLVKGKRIRELSFAYDTLEEGTIELERSADLPKDVTPTANELRKVDVFEFSFVPIGANRDTSVVAVKSATEALMRTLAAAPSVIDLKAGRVLSAKNEGALRAAYDSIGAVLDTLSNDDDAKAGDGSQLKADELSGVKADEAAEQKLARDRLSLALALADAEINTL